jgi:RNA polymerase sigma-70 factor (ECF subfamily)
MAGADSDAPAAGRARANGEDAALIARVIRGERAAFESLYQRFHPRLRRFLERMTRRPHLVDEIVNDTLLVVWRKAASYDGTSSVSTWIFAIGYRKALKALKQVDDPLDADLDQHTNPDAHGPDAIFLRQEVRALLHDALATLSPEQRAVVELTYFHECGYREIAAILDCPVDTVKTRMFHARRKLRTVLADQRGAMP